MGEIQKAIESFIQTRLAVYKADPQQIIRDTRAAERAEKDHAGRWLFELLQNSDDAEAEKVEILVEDDAIYFADNGNGLKPQAISALCGTDFSDKTHGTIGRKGIGFKSVYNVSQNAQVLTVGGEGVEFSREKAEKWLKQQGIANGYVPYQWIPFVISWDEAKRHDANLAILEKYRTIVKLPSAVNVQAIRQVLNTWPPHALFTFRHVRKIVAPNLSIEVIPDGQKWELRDSRGNIPEQWRVSIHHIPACLIPESVLKTLGPEERTAILEDGVNFRIAAPVAGGRVVPTAEYLPIHVYYPTEQTGPVRLLLHSEFLVKSDRTALIPLVDGTLNEWLAERLASYVCEFINDAYDSEKPSRNIALLIPFGDRTSHRVAERLWDFMSVKAKAIIRLANIDRKQNLTIGSAQLISVSVQPELARLIYEETHSRSCLLDLSYDGDRDARRALRELGCGEIHDQDLIAAIAEHAAANAENTQWMWACWQWLAEWAAKEPYGEKHAERIATLKKLPIVPVEGRLIRPEDLAGRIVTWKSEEHAQSLPQWLPLAFVDDWLRDRIRTSAEQGKTVQKLCAELNIREPKEDVIQLAVGQAIEQYWEDRQGGPDRFLRFVLLQDWHETSRASIEIQRCPVPLRSAVKGEWWSKACEAYFGKEWGNDLLEEIYSGNDDVAWVRRESSHVECNKIQRVLEWLGVATCPRIIESSGPFRLWALHKQDAAWKTYLEAVRDYCGRSVYEISAVHSLEHLTISGLNCDRAISLIRLIIKNWEHYYRDKIEIAAMGALPRERYYRNIQVKTKWWWEICEQLSVPRQNPCDEHVPLTAHWIPDKRTERLLGDLLHTLDLDFFGGDRNAVHEWLVNVVKLRSRIEQLSLGEWTEILSTRIPLIAAAERLASDERLRDKVTQWYSACLESIDERNEVPQGAFAACPLLCRKLNTWQYITDEPRYLDDDNDLAKAFAKDLWLFHLPVRLAAHAAKHFNVRNLSKSVQVVVLQEEGASPLSGELQERYMKSLPYIWAWRASQSKQDAERLAARMRRFEVYLRPTLKARLSLDGVCREVERRWYSQNDVIYLHSAYANETELAQAVARALNVPTESDFYENLMRCSSDEQRKEKLLSKGVAGEEVERLLREYSGQALEPGDETPRAKKTDTGPPLVKGGGPQVVPAGPAPAGGEKESQKPPPSSKPQGAREKTMRLKDFRTAEYFIGEHSQRGSETGGDGGGSGGGQYEGQALTDEEKLHLENASRHIATRELEKMGYEVEAMPQDNPGFDLRATRDAEELRVEVKGHTGRATIVDVTSREYREYLGQKGYKWELWNVEHLAAEDSDNIFITRYDELPDEALDVRLFRVNLRKCHSPFHRQTEN